MKKDDNIITAIVKEIQSLSDGAKYSFLKKILFLPFNCLYLTHKM
jgi:hypothetical protein